MTAIQDAMELEEAAGKQKNRLEKELKQIKETLKEANSAKERANMTKKLLLEIEAELQQDAGEQREALQRKAQAAARAMVDAAVAMGDRMEGLVGAWAARAPPKLAHSAALKLQAAAERDQRAAGERHQGLAARAEAAEKAYRAMLNELKAHKRQLKETLVCVDWIVWIMRWLPGSMDAGD